MRWELTNTVAGRAMKLAQTAKGVQSSDLKDKVASDVGKVLRKLVNQGYMTCIDESRRPYVYTATKEQADKWVADHTKQPKAMTIKPPKQRVQPVLSQPKPRPASKPKDERKTVYPVDADGNPLWKHTICPGFTGDPHKTNTHTGAY